MSEIVVVGCRESGSTADTADEAGDANQRDAEVEDMTHVATNASDVDARIKDSTNAASDAGEPDGATDLGRCETAGDCVLALVSCCGSCPPAAKDVIAVREEERPSVYQRDCATKGVMCGECPPSTQEVPAPMLRADCERGQCVVVVDPPP